MLANALSKTAAVITPEVRVLVVDSASSSGATRERAVSSGADYLRTDVRGLSIARNLGLEGAERDIIIFTDDDCEPAEGWLARLLAPFADPEVAAVTGTLLDSSRIDERITGERMTFTSIHRGLDAGHGALMAFRSQALADLGGFDDVLGAGRHFAGAEDLDMFCRLIAAGWKIVNEPQAIVRHMNTRDTESYRILLNGYGLGLGALANKWLRIAPKTGLILAGIVYLRASTRLLRQVGSARGRGGQLALLRGVSAGLLEARRLGLEGSRFIDDDRPAPTPLLEDGRSDAGAPQ